jgi:hypothetical protein
MLRHLRQYSEGSLKSLRGVGMDFPARHQEIAREVAQELQGEFGGELVAEIEKRLRSGSQTREGGFGGSVSDAAAVASVIIGCIQVYLQLQDRSAKKPDELLKRLEDEAPEPDQLSKEKRLGIIKRVVAKLTGKAAGKE